MEPRKDVAIVLKSVAFEERHRIVTALSLENGQISAIAKNSIQSRRFGGALDLFAASDWIFTTRPGSDLAHLSEAKIRESFSQLQADFSLLSVASALNEIMLRIAPQRQACPDLFRLHSNALAALNDFAKRPPSERTISEVVFLNAYLAKLLQWNGSQPKLQSCIQCNTSLNDIPFDAELTCRISSAGWACPGCRQHSPESLAFQNSFIRVSPAAIRDLQFSLCFPIRQIFHPEGWQKELQTQVRTDLKAESTASPAEHADLFQFLEGLFAFHVPGFDQKPLKSLRFLGLKSNLILDPKSNVMPPESSLQ